MRCSLANFPSANTRAGSLRARKSPPVVFPEIQRGAAGIGFVPAGDVRTFAQDFRTAGNVGFQIDLMGEVQEGEVIHAIGRRFADLLRLLVQLRFGVRSRIDRCDSGKPIRPPPGSPMAMPPQMKREATTTNNFNTTRPRLKIAEITPPTFQVCDQGGPQPSAPPPDIGQFLHDGRRIHLGPHPARLLSQRSFTVFRSKLVIICRNNSSTASYHFRSSRISTSLPSMKRKCR